MKQNDTDLHLTDDEVLRVMIDPSDLDPTRRAHLKSCLHCRRLAEALTHRCNRLGEMARQMAPEPRKFFRVPAHRAPVGRWHFKPAITLGVLGALVLTVALWGPNGSRTPQRPHPMVVRDGENDDRLMQEIDMLVEDALPQKYQQLAALSDDRSVEDLDAFMEWMAPIPEEADDVEQPSTSVRESRRDPLVWSDSTRGFKPGERAVHAQRGMV